MTKSAEIIGVPPVIGGRTLSLSKAVRAGDNIYLTGQIPMRDGAPMTTGGTEDQTRVTLDTIRSTLIQVEQRHQVDGSPKAIPFNLILLF